jgi:ABC-type multidrug transport system fused ATPase/permease subunit
VTPRLILLIEASALTFHAMRTSQYVIRSYRSIEAKERFKLWIYSFALFLLAILDIVGVLLVGLLLVQIQSIEFSSSTGEVSPLAKFLPSSLFEISPSASTVILLTSALICFSLKATTAPFLQKRVLVFLGIIATRFSRKIISELFTRDILFSQRRTSQETSFVLTNASFLTFQGIIGFFALMISEGILIFLILVLLLFVDFYLTVFIIVFFAAIILSLNRLSKIGIEKQNTILNSASIRAATVVQEQLRSYREVFVSQKSEYFENVIISNLKNSIDARANLTAISLLPKYVFDMGLILGITLVGGLAYTFRSPENAITLVGLFILCASRMMPALLRFNTGLQGIQNCSDASNRFYSLLKDLEESERLAIAPKQTLHQGGSDDPLVRVDRLTFGYPGNSNFVLEDLSFEVRFGEFLAIVGPSGSGKSTLIDIMMGVIHDPTNSISIGGLSPHEQVRLSPGIIGYVPQNVSLIGQSLLENIALGVPFHEINQLYVERAVERAALTDLVNSLPLGLNTLVGENGYNFSGGQRQRIGLARAFYSNPKILVLDEATSALDAETEHQISQMLASISSQITLIVVAHRLATVQKADRVLYLGGAGISEVGSFEELRARVSNFDLQAKLLGL